MNLLHIFAQAGLEEVLSQILSTKRITHTINKVKKKLLVEMFRKAYIHWGLRYQLALLHFHVLLDNPLPLSEHTYFLDAPFSFYLAKTLEWQG